MKGYLLYFAWIIACIATIGSLFYGEMKSQPLCTLCWYQRIVMFPLAIILGIAAFRQAHRIIYYALPLALIGLGIALYHVFSLNFSLLACKECIVPGMQMRVSLPFLSLGAFAIISCLLIWEALANKKSNKL